MSEKTFAFLSSDNKNKVSVKIWINEEVKPWAILQIAHGMVEHKERYAPFAEWLSDRGVIVCANDHLGHGDSVSCDADKGYIEGKKPDELIVEDMHTVQTQIHDAYPELAYFILGHSMGSYLLREYLAKYAEGLSGAIIMGTGQVDAIAVNMGLLLTKLLALFKGYRYRSRFIQGLTYDKYYKKFDLTGHDRTNSWLTRDPQTVKAYYDDPKSGFLFTLAGHKALFSAIAFDVKEKNVRAIPASLPMLVISGKNDPVGGCGEGVSKFFNILKETGHNKAELKLYDDARHEVLNEINRDEVFNDIYNWLRENLK